ncbi:MAG: Fic family protein [Bdellovibrionales bacterium]|nr:Fic family protein [Bdellovibrionales bacterium]
MKSFSPKFINSLSFNSSHLSTFKKLGEYRIKQGLFSKQSKKTLEVLKQHAIIESVESSNRLEQITAPYKRIKELVTHSVTPDNRPEQEIAGYRDAFSFIYDSHRDVEISVSVIKQLHKMLYHHLPEEGGYFKAVDNKIIERDIGRNTIRERFIPVSAAKTPQAISELCQSYKDCLNTYEADPMILFPLLILDFLCIHPFKDGNGRISRLLTLLILYRHGHEVGKYISLERIYEQSKEGYYNALQESSQGWHEMKHNPFPWMEYFWGVLLRSYKTFEEKIEDIQGTIDKKSPKTEQIKIAIRKKTVPFFISDIEKDCPNVSRDMIRNILRQLRDEGRVKSQGTGRGAKWMNIRGELSETMIKFKEERIDKILSNKTPLPLVRGPKIVLHIIPVEFFNKYQTFIINKLDYSDRGFDFQPISTFQSSGGGWNTRVNFDGFVNYDTLEKDGFFSYIQVFRNAVIEAVDTYSVATASADGSFLTPQNYEISIVQALSLYISSLVKRNIHGPCFVFLSLLGVKKYEIYNQFGFLRNRTTPIDRDNLLLPEIYIEEISNFSAPDVMKPAFDMVWNAGGYIGSRNYNKEGKWNPITY